ncbi:MAG: glycosyltransferase [Mucinivorans sp.]
MISILVCSISEERLANLQANIAQTIGVEYELLHIDNRVEKLSLSAAYNRLGERAAYPFLLFLHEDVKFIEQNWGKILEAKLQEPSCGVIGLAGSLYKSFAPSGWRVNAEFVRQNFYSYNDGKRQYNYTNPNQEEFSQVITTDGMFLCCTKRVWDQTRFDEKLFTGFHLYDLDFSMAVSQKQTNWICNTIRMEHHSNGSFDQTWFDWTELFHQKWDKFLPRYVGKLSNQEIEACEQRAAYNIAYSALKKGFATPHERRVLVWRTLRMTPLRINNIELVVRYLKSLLTN